MIIFSLRVQETQKFMSFCGTSPIGSIGIDVPRNKIESSFFFFFIVKRYELKRDTHEKKNKTTHKTKNKIFLLMLGEIGGKSCFLKNGKIHQFLLLLLFTWWTPSSSIPFRYFYRRVGNVVIASVSSVAEGTSSRVSREPFNDRKSKQIMICLCIWPVVRFLLLLFFSFFYHYGCCCRCYCW